MPSFAGKRVLVTGGAGVIGRELLDRLVQSDAQILSVDRLPLPDRMDNGIGHRQIDLADGDLDFIGAFRPQVVFHLAASFERSRETTDFWPINWRDNLLASHRVIDAVAREGDLETLVFASSYLVYSTSLYLSDRHPAKKPTALGEDRPLSPRNLCGAAKLYTEGELAFLPTAMRRPVRTVSARIFRVYGRGSRDVISRWTRAALRREPLNVYHPENRFDYVYAGDVAEGLLRLGTATRAHGPVNLATGHASRIQEVLDTLQGFAPPGTLRVHTRRIDEPFEASCANVDKLRQLTRWSPGTPLKQGMRTIWEFEEARVGRS